MFLDKNGLLLTADRRSRNDPRGGAKPHRHSQEFTRPHGGWRITRIYSQLTMFVARDCARFALLHYQTPPHRRGRLGGGGKDSAIKKLGRPLDLGREYSPLGAVTVFILSHPHLNLPPSMGKTYKALSLSFPLTGKD